MPANGFNGVRDNVVQVDAVDTYTFNRTDTYAAVSAVPGAGVGTVLKLPTNPQAGDRYEFSCTDGSCGGSAPIVVEVQDRSTIQGASSVQFTQSYAWGVLIYQGGTAAPGSWMLYTEVNAGGGNYTTGTVQTPHTQTAGAAFCAIEAVMVEAKSSGVFRASWHCDFVCDTTAENISVELVAIPFATAAAFAAGASAFGVTGEAFVGNSTLAPAAQTNAGLAPYLATLSADAAGTAANGLTYGGTALNDGATGALQLGVEKFPTLAGLLTASGAGTNTAMMSFGGSMLFTKTTNPKVPYAQGTFLVLALAVKGTGGILTFAPVSLTLEEVANG